MKVGTICKLKVDCLAGMAGELGVVFKEDSDVFIVVFEKGGLSSHPLETTREVEEADRFLSEVGFEESLAGYKFQNVKTVSEDYRTGLFNIAWSKKWQGEYEPFGPDEYEKCEICVEEDSRKPWLYFKREAGGTVEVLSAAKDYVDFSHFEYSDIGIRLDPRWMNGDKTIYPKYVVFRKKGK